MSAVKELAREALDTPTGEALQARNARRVLLLDLVDRDPNAERLVVEGMLEAEDQGEAMARAVFSDLRPTEQRRISEWAEQRARDRCEVAARELLIAAESLGETEVEPAHVALLAAGPACGKAVR
jgi:hypothetical protein